MQRLRFDTYPSPWNRASLVEPATVPNSEFEDSIVDYSLHQPASRLAQDIRNGRIMGALANAYYDFPDGKDDGTAIPVSRKKGVDLAEVQEEIQDLSSAVDQAVQDGLRKQKRSAKADVPNEPVAALSATGDVGTPPGA